MENLLKKIKGEEDLFSNDGKIDLDLLKEYYERNERKKDDDKWLKANKSKIVRTMQAMDKQKADFDDIRVSYSEPDQSYFDEEKVLEWALSKGMYEMVTKSVLDEEALTLMIERKIIDLEEIQEVAWVEKKGTPRVILSQVKKNEA